jgi:hypothetical protein
MKFYKDITLNVELITDVGNFLFSFPDQIEKDVVSNYTSFNHPAERSLSQSFLGKTGLNKFIFSNDIKEEVFLFEMKKGNSDQQVLDASGVLELYPSVSGIRTGNFISGINIDRQGIYSEVPSVNFDSYSGIIDISVNELNLISENAGDNFNLIFSGNGTGVSATAHTKIKKIKLYENQNPSSEFRMITGITINSGGYGFNESYSVVIPDYIIDYPKSYSDGIASSLGYSPVSFSTVFMETAGAASGIAVLSSGTSGNLSGIIILGAGTGYLTGAVQFPKFNIIRNSSDVFKAQEVIYPDDYAASGTCIMNSSGEDMSFDKKFNFLYSREFGGEYIPLTNFDADKKISHQIAFPEGVHSFYLKVQSNSSSVLGRNFINYNFYESGSDSPKNSSYITVYYNYNTQSPPIKEETFGGFDNLEILE